MEIGTVFPTLEIGVDPARIADYGQRAEDAGYHHLLTYDHVLGVSPDREGWEGPYDNDNSFHEPMTTFGYLAGQTDDIEFVTGILVLPQRQTPLVAKQAAQLDVLSDGRLRLGVGAGWNRPEYTGMGESFDERSRRIVEQFDVLRKLWTEETVDYEGEFHTLPEVGINPRPVQQPIPLWLGGMGDLAKRRVAGLADGWLPQFQPGEDAETHLEDVYGYAEEYDRDPDDIGIHGRMYAVPDEEDEWIDRAQAWKELGADYLAVSTMYQGLDSVEHADHIESVADTLRETGLF